jgi:hypothetical protein
MLVASDLPIVRARRRLIALAKALDQGIALKAPSAVEHCAVRPISRLTSIADFDEFLTRHSRDLQLSRPEPEAAPV